MARETEFLKLFLPSENEYYNVEKDQNENFEKIDTKLKEWDKGKEPAIVKKTAFNLDKSDEIDIDDSTKLATSKAVKKINDEKVSKNGDTMTGDLYMADGKVFVGSYNYGHRLKDKDGNERYFGYIDESNRIHVGYQNLNPVFFDTREINCLNGKVWNEGNFNPNTKLNISGGTLQGDLDIVDGKRIIGAYNYGFSLKTKTGESKYFVFINPENEIQIGHANEIPINFSTVPTIQKQMIYHTGNIHTRQGIAFNGSSKAFQRFTLPSTWRYLFIVLSSDSCKFSDAAFSFVTSRKVLETTGYISFIEHEGDRPYDYGVIAYNSSNFTISRGKWDSDNRLVIGYSY